MAVDHATLVRVAHEAAEQAADAADKLFTVLDEEMARDEQGGGPESGIFQGIDPIRHVGLESRVAQVLAADTERAEALRRLVSEAIPYVARHAEIETAVAWLRRADELGCRTR